MIVGDSVYRECGLIAQIQDFITDIVSGQFGEKLKSRADFLDIFEDRWNKEFFRANWSVFLAKHKIIELDSEIKAQIITLFDTLSEDIQDTFGKTIKGFKCWVHWLLHIDIILSYLLYHVGVKIISSEDFKKIRAYYDFLRSEIEKRGLLIPEPFNIEPISRFWANQTKTKKPRMPKCKHCGSEDVIKWSKWRYRCNKCGRTFTKLK